MPTFLWEELDIFAKGEAQTEKVHLDFSAVQPSPSEGLGQSILAARRPSRRVGQSRLVPRLSAVLGQRRGDAPFGEIRPERSRQVAVSVSKMSAYQAQLRPSASSRTRSRVPTSSRDE
jgi:hypothetical protein